MKEGGREGEAGREMEGTVSDNSPYSWSGLCILMLP